MKITKVVKTDNAEWATLKWRTEYGGRIDSFHRTSLEANARAAVIERLEAAKQLVPQWATA